jgi:hypothetical protein
MLGQSLGVNESGKLSSNHLWVRLILYDCAVSCWKQKLFSPYNGMFEQMIFQYMFLVDYNTRFDEK